MGDFVWGCVPFAPKALFHIVGFFETCKEMEAKIRDIAKGKMHFSYSPGVDIVIDMVPAPTINVYFERREDAALVKLFLEN